jgi:hypothetical protein
MDTGILRQKLRRSKGGDFEMGSAARGNSAKNVRLESSAVVCFQSFASISNILAVD